MKAVVMMVCAAVLGCDSGGGDEGPDTDPLVNEGEPFPSVTVQDCAGGEVVLRDWIAQHDVSFVTFGAQWCVPCAEEATVINRELVEGLASYGDRVSVVQILIEQQPDEAPSAGLCQSWTDFVDAQFDVMSDVRRENLAPFFGTAVSTLPLHLVVTKDGVVRYKKLGALPVDVKDVVEGWLP